MKNKIISLVVIIINIFIFMEIILNNQMIFNTIGSAVDTWLNVLIPSLFPFFIISDILIDYNIINYIPKKIKSLFSKIFNVSDSGLTVIILSMISGFPSNARNARTMLDKGLITEQEASHVLMYTHFSNPLFVLTTVGVVFLNNKLLGVIILLAHFTSNIILGILVRNLNIRDNSKITTRVNYETSSFGLVLTNAIRHALDTLFLIFGTLTIFLVIASIVINRFKVGVYNSVILKGILEITIGLQQLSLLNLNNLYIVVISAMMISFGGLSVHMQVISQIVGTNIKYKYFFRGRIYQAVIAGALAILFYYIFI